MNPRLEIIDQQLRAVGPENAPDWLDALRSRDRQRFVTHGFPHRRLEDWKYTPLDRLEVTLATEPGDDGDDPVAGARGELVLDDALALTLVNGALGERPDDLPEGVTLLTLEEALTQAPDALREALEALDTAAPEQAMGALNNASLRHGLVLRVAAGTDAGTVLLSWRDDGDPGTLQNTRLILVLEDGAGIDLVEDYAITGALNVVHQVRLGARSRLRHARLQDGGAGSWLIARTEVQQGADSVFEQASLDLGAGLARHDLRARLAAPGARNVALGAYLPTGDAHVDHHLDVRHESTACTSEQTFRGVLHDRGRAVFNGRVHVLPGADDSEAHQSNQNLLLSRDAEVDTKPELIIEADEVVASHGATVGQLDETAVFYLRSRGIDDASARQMLTGAFCRAVIGAMTNEGAREAFLARLEQRLVRRLEGGA